MQSKTLIIIGILLGVLLVVWGMALLTGTRSTIILNDLDIFSISPSTVDTLVIEENDNRIELKEDTGVWYVGEYVVSPERMSRVWDTFAQLTLQGPVSRNSENHEKFGVSDTALAVTLRKDDHERTLRIGNQATTFDTTYVRNASHDEVYIALHNLRSLFSLQVDDWRDPTVTAVPPEQITRIEVEQGRAFLNMGRNTAGDWEIIDDYDEEAITIDSTRIEGLLFGLNPLSARGFVAGEGVREFKRRKLDGAVRLFTNGQLIVQLDIVEEGEYYWVRASGNDTVYEVEKYKMVDVLLTREDLVSTVNE